MKIIFMGTPDFSVPILQALHQDHEIVSVYCQPPRPAGRGQTHRPSPVQACAEQLGLTVKHPTSLRSEEVQQEFAALGADLAVVVAYGLILPQEVLDAPRLGCLNIHASLLPRWRGAAPIHRAIMAGDHETGICVMQMDQGLDTGPVLLKSAISIDVDETTASLQGRLQALGALLILQAIAGLPLPAIAQNQIGVSYAAKITKSETRVDWTKTALEIDRQIRGLSPVPGAWCLVKNERVKLLQSRVLAHQGAPGQVVTGFIVACGQGAVEITSAQREGRRPATAADFLNGLALPDVLT